MENALMSLNNMDDLYFLCSQLNVGENSCPFEENELPALYERLANVISSKLKAFANQDEAASTILSLSISFTRMNEMGELCFNEHDKPLLTKIAVTLALKNDLRVAKQFTQHFSLSSYPEAVRIITQREQRLVSTATTTLSNNTATLHGDDRTRAEKRNRRDDEPENTRPTKKSRSS